MIMKLLSLRDRKAMCFLAPFVSRSWVDATRQLKLGLQNPQMAETPVGQNPEDFDLYEVGTFDDETGVLVNCEPVLVANVGDLRGGTVTS